MKNHTLSALVFASLLNVPLAVPTVPLLAIGMVLSQSASAETTSVAPSTASVLRPMRPCPTCP